MNNDYAVRWRSATLELNNGNMKRGLIALSDLYRIKDAMDIKLRAEVAYSYGVALLMSGNFAEALKVLEEYRNTAGYGSDRFNAIDVTIEISYIYTAMHNFEPGLLEAQKAIDMQAESGLTGHLAFFNKGLAEIGLKRYDDAEKDLKNVLSISCEKHNLMSVGIACEHLGRIAFQRGFLDEAMAWSIKSREIYFRHAPQFIVGINNLIKQINDSTEGEPIRQVQPVEFALLEQLVDVFDINEYDCRLDVLDIDLYQFLIGSKIRTGNFNIKIPLHGVIKTQADLLYSEIMSISEHYYYPDIIAGSFLIKKLGLDENQIPVIETLKSSSNINILQGLSPHLNWDCTQSWPCGFRPLLFSLSKLHTGAYFSIKMAQQNYQSAENVRHEFISIIGRTWPRAIQSKYIGLGEFETGAVRVPTHIIEDITRQGINDQKYNIDKFLEMKFSPDEAKELSDGGLIAIPFSQLGSLIQGMSTLPISYGGLPFEDYNPENPPKSQEPPNIDDARIGFFLDKYYQTTFFARVPKNYALYGKYNDKFREQYNEFRKKVNIIGSLRAKYYAIPIIEAGSLEELKYIVSCIPEIPELKTGIYLRGQSKPYYLKRPKSVNNILYGMDNVIEPSLLGADQRYRMNYNKAHSMLQVLLQDFIYQKADTSSIDLESLHKEWFKIASSPTGDWDTSVMALAQHYGIPTFGLDITSSVEVATWFATNKFNSHDDGTAEYNKMSEHDWNQDSNYWPIVYIVQPVTKIIAPSIRNIEPLTSLGVKALRPERQHAQFFMGSQGIYQNRLSEALVCQVRLKPGTYETGLKYNYLFPGPDEDPIYKFMLDLREKYSNGPYGKFFEKIVPYRRN